MNERIADRFSIDFLRKRASSEAPMILSSGGMPRDAAMIEVIVPRSDLLLGALEKAGPDGIPFIEAVDLLKASGLAKDIASAMPIIVVLRNCGLVGYTEKGTGLRLADVKK